MKKKYQNIETDIALKLRTLNFIRWIAISGQLLSVIIAYFYFELVFNISFALILILFSTILNIYLYFKFPATKSLTFNELTYYLLYDLMQLIFLLLLTGGLSNPFCILILAPVVISSTYLDLRRTAIVCFASAISLTFLLFQYIPIQSNLIAFDSNDYSSFEITSIWGSLIVTLIFISAYCFRVASESRKTSNALRETQLTLSNEEKISALMSLTAAAVHELGTPLSTISIIAKELVESTSTKDKNFDDLAIIQTQIKRCADILKRLRANNFSESSDEFINKLSLTRLINEILEDYSNEKKNIKINSDSLFDQKNIIVSRSPEIVQSLSNIIDNAYKYAKNEIIINLKDAKDRILIEIIDDGKGFSSEIFSLLGEPYVKRSIDDQDHGLGLGLFISKNLLNKTFGDIKFLNSDKFGACVQIFLDKEKLNTN